MANVGKMDRVIRVVVGAAMMALPYITSFPLWEMSIARWGIPAAGLVFVLTGLFSFCPIYRILGINSCKI